MPRRRVQSPEIRLTASPLLNLLVASSVALGAYAVLSRAYAAVLRLLSMRQRRLVAQQRAQYFSQHPDAVNAPLPDHLQTTAGCAAAAAAASRRRAKSPSQKLRKRPAANEQGPPAPGVNVDARGRVLDPSSNGLPSQPSAAQAAAASQRHDASRGRKPSRGQCSEQPPQAGTAGLPGPSSSSGDATGLPPTGGVGEDNEGRSEHPFASPARYLPEPNPSADRVLRVREEVRVRGGAGAWIDASALLDTGNSHMTVIDLRYAELLGLYSRDPQSVFGRPIRHATLRGVVPGAESLAPVVLLMLTIRAREFTLEAAVSEMGGQHLLLGLDVLEPLFAEGFRLGATSTS